MLNRGCYCDRTLQCKIKKREVFTVTSMQLADILADRRHIIGELSRIEYLDKGYSPAQKWVLHSADDNRYLLRMYDIESHDEMRGHFDVVEALWREGVACPRPVLFDTSEDHEVCFSIQTYIQGRTAQEVLPDLTEAVQYKAGAQAGRELRKMQTIYAASIEVNTWSLLRREYKQQKDYLDDLGVGFRGRDRVVKYIKNNMKLLRGRPTSFCHGDYHPGNIVYQDNDLAGVIDFESMRYSDPIFDFHKAALSALFSLPYARGQVVGYFDGEPPQDFWQLYNLYAALTMFSDMAWNAGCDPENLDNTTKLIELVGDMHEFETAGPPYWWSCG